MERTASPGSVMTNGSRQLRQCCFDSTHLKDREPLLKVLFGFQRITRMLCLHKVHRWKPQQYTKGGCFRQINHIMGTISSQSRPISLQRSDETCFLPLHHVRTQESTSYEVWVLFRHWLYKHLDPGLFTLPMWEIHAGSLDPDSQRHFSCYTSSKWTKTEELIWPKSLCSFKFTKQLLSLSSRKTWGHLEGHWHSDISHNGDQ